MRIKEKKKKNGNCFSIESKVRNRPTHTCSRMVQLKLFEQKSSRCYPLPSSSLTYLLAYLFDIVCFAPIRYIHIYLVFCRRWLFLLMAHKLNKNKNTTRNVFCLDIKELEIDFFFPFFSRANFWEILSKKVAVLAT